MYHDDDGVGQRHLHMETNFVRRCVGDHALVVGEDGGECLELVLLEGQVVVIVVVVFVLLKGQVVVIVVVVLVLRRDEGGHQFWFVCFGSNGTAFEY